MIYSKISATRLLPLGVVLMATGLSTHNLTESVRKMGKITYLTIKVKANLEVPDYFEYA